MASNSPPDPAVHDASGHAVQDAVAADHGHAHSHAHPPRHYVKIWLWLVVLFLVSVTGPMIGIWWLTLVTAFGIAVVKAGLVVKHFMHLDVEQPFVHYFLATSLVFMFLFFAGVAPDVMNHDGSNWVNEAANAETERAFAEAEHAPDAEHAPAH